MTELKKIVITRIFNAPREKVWRAWTDPELVKKWWGPEGFTAPSIKIDLRVGGKYIFAMRGPKDSEWDRDMYTSGVYKEVIPYEKIVTTDYFSDEDGNKANPTDYGMSADTPDEMTVIVRFEEVGNSKTKLTIEYPRELNPQIEAMKKSGMVEGWNSSLDKLAKVLANKRSQ